MAGVYATFRRDGCRPPRTRSRRSPTTARYWPASPAPAPVRALPAAVAGNVTDVLRGVIALGTGSKAQALGRTAAGKTGNHLMMTVPPGSSATPRNSPPLSSSSEDSNHQPQSLVGVGGLQKVFGGDIPTEIWIQYMRDALAGLPDAPFPAPAPLGRGADEPGAPTPSPSAAPAKRAARAARRPPPLPPPHRALPRQHPPSAAITSAVDRAGVGHGGRHQPITRLTRTDLDGPHHPWHA